MARTLRERLHVCMVGLLLGTLFFAASLTPSLVPRPTLVQGALGGLSFAAGYGLGVVLRAVWLTLELPVMRPARAWRVGWAAAAVCAGLAAVALWRASMWQNTLRALMDMDPVETVRPFTIAATALAVFLALLLLGRLIGWVARRATRRLARRLPGPQALILGVGLTALLFWNIGNGVIVRGAFTAFDSSYARLDALIEDESRPPADPERPGGAASLLDWEDLGRAGREMLATTPDAATIAAITGAPADTPLRVYVGLGSARDPQARAALALAELIRAGGFDRGHLILNTPTGTGWVDPGGQLSAEYLLRGDVATVAVQYSYLASWIALLADPDYGVETAREVFSAIYGYWRSLPPEDRPRLWLHGLSLGALNSDLSHDLFQVIGDPYDGALWVGPPFASRTWSRVTRNRDAGTPAWLPRYRDAEVIRFLGPGGAGAQPDPTAGPPALPGDAGQPGYGLVYLQYASDAVTFFDPAAAWRRPAWLEGLRGPDVSPDMRWLPVVTFLQLGMDIMMAVLPPVGHGHSYALRDYLEGWIALTGAPGWSAQELAALRQRLADAP